MKIFITVDMEGISGICRKSQVNRDMEDYQKARYFMTWDVNACVEGCIRGGATEIIVRDAHSNGFNLIWEELDPRAVYIQGRSPKYRMPGIEECDGLILLGYHAMAGTSGAILEHTMSSASWQNFWINGTLAGEFAIDAALAGDYNVPTIMVSGDDKVCKEAKRFIKNIVTVEVKKGLDIEGGILLPKEIAHKKIKEGAEKAVKLCKKIKPYKVKHPVKMRLEMVERGIVPQNRPYVKLINGRTYEVTGKNVEEALKLLIG